MGWRIILRDRLRRGGGGGGGRNLGLFYAVVKYHILLMEMSLGMKLYVLRLAVPWPFLFLAVKFLVRNAVVVIAVVRFHMFALTHYLSLLVRALCLGSIRKRLLNFFPTGAFCGTIINVLGV